MPKLQSFCRTCHKPAEELSVESIGDLRLVTLKCLHSYSYQVEPLKEWEKFGTKFGLPARLRPFQGRGYEFARESNFRCIIADEPGLGKTAQSLVCLGLHPEELLPALIVVKSALTTQYQYEVLRWLGPEFTPQVIKSSQEEPSSALDVHIVSYDLLYRFTKNLEERRAEEEKAVREKLGLREWNVLPKEEQDKLTEVVSPFAKFGYKCVILDECQQIKNQTSKRAQQVRDICKEVPHVILTSGSPIENNAGEYFTALNIVNPERFPNFRAYLENYCRYYFDGYKYKVGGLRDVEWFRNQTNDFIIRRRMDEVLPELPKLNRKFVNCDFASEKMKKSYQKLLQEFSEYFYSHKEDENFSQHILAKIAVLRHQAGVNKVNFVSEHVIEFINDTVKKIVIFTHHRDVEEMIYTNLCNEFEEMRKMGSEIANPVQFLGGMAQSQRDAAKKEFIENPNCRVFIASLTAAGEGLDGLQKVCSDCIVVERHFNPKKEEQAEKRIQRFGALGNPDSWINAEYILSIGTIDEWFTELVEIKRAAVDQTLDGVEMDWNEASLTMELAEILARKGAKKWKLK